MIKSTLIVGLFLVVVPCLTYAADPKCHTNEAMQCVDMMIDWVKTLPKRSIPESEDQVATMCTDINKAFDCFHRFFDSCLTPMQKELVDLVVEGIHTFRYSFCDPASESRAKYLQHATCLNKVSQGDEVKETIEYILAMVEKIPKIDNSQKILYSCCAYASGYNKFQAMGREGCGQEAVDAAKQLASEIVSSLPDVICSGFTGTEEKCTAILPAPGSKPTETLKGSATYDYVRNALSNWLD